MILKFKLFEKNVDNADFARTACQSLGYTYEGGLGSGSYGTAFEIEDKDGNIFVMKITKDGREANMANKLRKRPVSKHLINYYDVRKIISDDYPYERYVIIMDKVTPLDQNDIDIYDEVGCNVDIETFIDLYDPNKGKVVKSFYISKYTLLDLVARNKFSYSIIDEKRKKTLLKQIDDAMKKEKSEEVYYMYKQLIELYKELKKNSVWGVDIHTGNLGWDDDHELVYFDIGCENVESTGKKLKHLVHPNI